MNGDVIVLKNPITTASHDSRHRAAEKDRLTVAASPQDHVKTVAITSRSNNSGCQATEEAAAPPHCIDLPTRCIKRSHRCLGC